MSLFNKRLELTAAELTVNVAATVRCSLYRGGNLTVHKHDFLVVPRVGELICVQEEGREIMYRVLQVTHIAAGAWRGNVAPTPEIQIEVTRKPAPIAGIDD